MCSDFLVFYAKAADRPGVSALRQCGPLQRVPPPRAGSNRRGVVREVRKLALTLALSALPLAVQPALAQTTSSNASINMWGTVPGGVSVPGALDSALGHYWNGVGAAQVNAAKIGALYGNGQGGTIEAIGSQTIVSTSIIGNSSVANVSASQTSSNSGSVTNSGQMGKTITGNQN